MNFIKILWWDVKKKFFWVEIFGRFLDLIPGNSGNIIRGHYWSTKLGGCGNNLRVSSNFKTIKREKIKFGSNISINSNCYITASGGLEIGNNVLIGPDVKIWTMNHNYKRRDIPIMEQGWTYDSVVIGNDVWIASNVIILPGVKIPDGVVIAAGSIVVPSQIESYSVYCGHPLKKINTRI